MPEKAELSVYGAKDNLDGQSRCQDYLHDEEAWW